jgi:hypothetical protein
MGLSAHRAADKLTARTSANLLDLAASEPFSLGKLGRVLHRTWQIIVKKLAAKPNDNAQIGRFTYCG